MHESNVPLQNGGSQIPYSLCNLIYLINLLASGAGCWQAFRIVYIIILLLVIYSNVTVHNSVKY